MNAGPCLMRFSGSSNDIRGGDGEATQMFGRGSMIESRLRIGSIDVGDTCTAFMC